MERLLRLAAEAGVTETAGDPVTLLLQYGVLGVFAVLLIIYTRSSIKRELEKADRAEAQVQELNDFIRNELLPKQVEATILHKQVAEVLEEAVQLITEMKYRDGHFRSDPPRGRRG